MAYWIEWDTRASVDFDKLDNSIKPKIKKYLERLVNAKNPKEYGKALTGNLAGCWRYRIKDYRIGARIQDNKLTILIIAIDHRKDIYKKLSKRFKDYNQ